MKEKKQNTFSRKLKIFNYKFKKCWASPRSIVVLWIAFILVFYFHLPLSLYNWIVFSRSKIKLPSLSLHNWIGFIVIATILLFITVFRFKKARENKLKTFLWTLLVIVSFFLFASIICSIWEKKPTCNTGVLHCIIEQVIKDSALTIKYLGLTITAIGGFFSLIVAQERVQAMQEQIKTTQKEAEETRKQEHKHFKEEKLQEQYFEAIKLFKDEDESIKLGAFYTLYNIAEAEDKKNREIENNGEESQLPKQIIDVLCGFIRSYTREDTYKTRVKEQNRAGLEKPTALIQSMLTTMTSRKTEAFKNIILDLSGAYLTDADLTDAYLTDADLTDAYLTGADLTDADLTGADLTDADLTGADLMNVNLIHAHNVNLTGAHLMNVNLIHAHLDNVNLTGADLMNVNLIHAHLDNVNLTGI